MIKHCWVKSAKYTENRRMRPQNMKFHLNSKNFTRICNGNETELVQLLQTFHLQFVEICHFSSLTPRI